MFLYIRLVYLILSFYHPVFVLLKDACVECNNGLELARSQAFRLVFSGWHKTAPYTTDVGEAFQVYVTTIHIV